MSKETVWLNVEGMSCSHCEKRVKEALDAIRGVISVSVNLDEGKVAVDYDTTGVNEEQIKRTIIEAGYGIEQ